jgi:hypothetical protein
VAALIAAQREQHQIPHAVACRALGVSRSWFYKLLELMQATHDRPLPVAGGCRQMTALADAFSQFRGGQGQDRTVDLPLFRRSVAPDATG